MFHLLRHFNKRINEKFNIMPDTTKALEIGEAYTFDQLVNSLSKTKGQYLTVKQQLKPGGQSYHAVLHYTHKSGFDIDGEPTKIANGQALLFYADGDVLTADDTDQFYLTGI